MSTENTSELVLQQSVILQKVIDELFVRNMNEQTRELYALGTKVLWKLESTASKRMTASRRDALRRQQQAMIADLIPEQFVDVDE